MLSLCDVRFMLRTPGPPSRPPNFMAIVGHFVKVTWGLSVPSLSLLAASPTGCLPEGHVWVSGFPLQPASDRQEEEMLSLGSLQLLQLLATKPWRTQIQNTQVASALHEDMACGLASPGQGAARKDPTHKPTQSLDPSLLPPTPQPRSASPCGWALNYSHRGQLPIIMFP